MRTLRSLVIEPMSDSISTGRMLMSRWPSRNCSNRAVRWSSLRSGSPRGALSERACRGTDRRPCGFPVRFSRSARDGCRRKGLQPGLRSTQAVLLLPPRRSLVERPNLGPRLVVPSSSTLSRSRWKTPVESPPKRPFGARLGATLPW